MNQAEKNGRYLLSKVPEVTIFFWIIKILCTTVGETFSDFINENLGLGLINTTIIMGIAFFAVVYFQFRVTKYIPGLYWLTVVLISVFGTLVTDNLTDGMSVPLEFSTILFSILLLLTFLFWFLKEKTLSIHSIYTRRREVFYWLTILFTFALGTAVGDLYSEHLGLGYLPTGILVASIIVCIFLVYRFLKLDAVLSFWVAYIFTRPLGASIGDFLSQPSKYGGLGLGATITSLIFLSAILGIIIFLAVTKCDIKSGKETYEDQHREDQYEIEINKNVLRQTIAVLCVFLVVGTSSYVYLSNRITKQTDASQTTLKGQLTDFIITENSMLSDVNANDFAAAKTSADNLEHEWDTQAAALQKTDKKTWSEIDGTIDSVLASTRSGNPDSSKCLTALTDSLSALNTANE